MNLLIVGANGLVGQAVLAAALSIPDVKAIVTLTRQPLARHSLRVRSLTLPQFSEEGLATLDLGGLDACIGCVGILPIGVREPAYRLVTIDLTRRLADAFLAANPAARFVYVSGAGADQASRFMPLRVKGQAEAALVARHPNSVLLRPGVVVPTPDLASPYLARRWAYALGAGALWLAGRLVPGATIRSDVLGRAALAACGPAVSPGVLDGPALLRLGQMNPKRL